MVRGAMDGRIRGERVGGANAHHVDERADQQVGQGEDGEDEADDGVAGARELLGLRGEEGGHLLVCVVWGGGCGWWWGNGGAINPIEKPHTTHLYKHTFPTFTLLHVPPRPSRS